MRPLGSAAMSKARGAVLGLAGLAAGGAAGASARRAESRAVARWAGNVDPMACEPTALDGEELTITTRDGGQLRVVRAGATAVGAPGPGSGDDAGSRPMAVLAHGITASADEWA